MYLSSGEQGGDKPIRAEAREGPQGQSLPGPGDRVEVPRGDGTLL